MSTTDYLWSAYLELRDNLDQNGRAFLTGVGIGTAVGILIAQQSGEDTRQKISDTVAKVTAAAHGKIDGVADRLTPNAAKRASVGFPAPAS